MTAMTTGTNEIANPRREIPAGLGPTLAMWRAVAPGNRARTWITYWPALLILIGLFVFRIGTAYWYFAVPAAIGTYAILVWMENVTELYAGDGWLSNGTIFVRTDRLKKVKYYMTMTDAKIVFEDSAGTDFRPRSTEVTADPEIWRLVSEGVRTSYAAGLRPDRRTRRIFELPLDD